MSEKPASILCEICPSSKARFKCSDCQQYVCENCLTYHQKFNATYKHIVCPLPLTEPAEIPTDCAVHNLRIEFYCRDDETACCHKCKDTCHKKCMKVEHFSIITSKKEMMITESYELKTKIESKRKESDKCHQLLIQNTGNWNKRITGILGKMKDLMNDLEEKVKQKQSNLEDLMKKREVENKTLTASYADSIQDLGCKMNKLRASMIDSEHELVMAILEIEKALGEYKSLLCRDPCEGHTVAFLKEEHRFEAEHYVSRTLEEMVETAKSIYHIYTEMQRNSLQNKCTGVKPAKSVVVRSRSADEGSNTGKIPARVRTLSEREKVKHYESLVPVKETSVPELPVTSLVEINIHMADDENTCAITGIAELSSGNIIMSDFKNFKMKLMDKYGRIIHSVKTEKEPRDIAVIDGNNVMVSVPMAKCIQFVEIYEDKDAQESRMTLVKKYSVDGKCCGIAYHDKKIYTATQTPTQILILDISGNKIHSIPGDNLFERPTYTTVAPNGSLIYMSDPNHKFVYGLTRDGKIHFKYPVEGPHGITTNEKGELFVADFDTSSVHLVSTNGQKIGNLSPENCNCPQKVSYNKQTNHLLVTMWNSDVIYKVQLQMENSP